MKMHHRVRRALSATTAAALTLGLASMAPRREMAEAIPAAIDCTAEGIPRATEADKRAANFGAYLVGFIGEKRERRLNDEMVTVTALGNGALHLMLTREVGSTAPGAIGGGYYMDVVTRQTASGELSPCATSYTVMQTVTIAGEGPLPTYFLNAESAGTGWMVSVDQRTKRYGGAPTGGNTGASLSADYTDQLIDVAQTVVEGEHAGKPTDYVPYVAPAGS